MYTCDNCGSTEVDQKVWIRLNTEAGKELDSVAYGDKNNPSDNWCNVCEDHTTVTFS
jgi:hypothetical protein